MTKTIALALVAALAGTTASAGNAGFGLQRSATAADTLTVDLVRADTAGTVSILDYRAGVIGPVLGTSTVQAGANNDVLVKLDREPIGDVMAVIYDANGETVAQKRIILND